MLIFNDEIPSLFSSETFIIFGSINEYKFLIQKKMVYHSLNIPIILSKQLKNTRYNEIVSKVITFSINMENLVA